MHFHIRTNFNDKIGLGHLSRTSRLANKIIEKGFECSIYVDKYEKNFLNFNKKIKIFSLYQKGRFINESKDSHLFIQKTWSSPGIVIADDYRLTKIWERKILKFHTKIIVLEDLNTSQHYADIIINSNPTFIDSSKYNYNFSLKKNCSFLLGPKYSLINSQFNKKPKTKNFKLVFYNGGSGDLTFIEKLIRQIVKENKNLFFKTQFKVIISPLSKCKKKIITLKKKYKNINIIENETNINNVLINSSLLVSSSGMISLEASYCKIPSLLFQVSKNQFVDRISMEKIGHYLMLRKEALANKKKIAKLITLLILNYHRLKKITFSHFSVDAKGADRIIKQILSNNRKIVKNNSNNSNEIKTNQQNERKIEKVNDKNINAYLEMRNLKKNRQYIKNKKKISFLDHYIWWFSSKRNSFILKKNKKPVMFFYNDKTSFKNSKIVWTGWNASESGLSGLDVLWALKRNINWLKKKYKKFYLIGTAHKDNLFANSHTKFLGYKLIGKDNLSLIKFIKIKLKLSNKFNIYIRKF